jgi:hypothetical protein
MALASRMTMNSPLRNAVMKALDPARLGWPPTMPYELVLRTGTPREICESYGIDRDKWAVLRVDPRFVAAVEEADEKLREEGMAFKVKARLQSEELLQTSWGMIHDADTPHNVRADLLKFTIRAAGLDGSKDQAAQAAHAIGNALNIQINLG